MPIHPPDPSGGAPRERIPEVHTKAMAVLAGAMDGGLDASSQEDLANALRLLRAASLPTREQALSVTLAAAVFGGTLGLVQNRALRLIVEALGLGLPFLRTAFRDRAGQDLPDLWDPSDPEAWARRSAAPPSPWDDAQAEAPPPRPPPVRFPSNPRIERIKALALLGLDEGASLDDVKRAFHRVSKVHHPDSFAGLGDDAVADAAASFRRIRDAYEFLTREGTR